MKNYTRAKQKQETRDTVAQAMQPLWDKIEKAAAGGGKHGGRSDSNKPGEDARGCH